MSDERPYSKRELDTFMIDLKAQLDRIETQTTKTNGRVRALEFWRGIMMGGGIIITLIVLPMGAWVYTTNIDHIRTSILTLRTEVETK